MSLTEKILKEAAPSISSLESRENYKGIPYGIYYNAPRGYFAKDHDKIINSRAFFDTIGQAAEHAELEIDGYFQK